MPGGDNVDAAVERRIAAEEGLHRLARLPRRQREAVVLTAVQGRSGAEAASMLGVSEGALNQLVHRARGKLRRAASAILPLPVAAHIGEVSTGAVAVGAGAGATKLFAAAALSGAIALSAVEAAPVPHHHHHAAAHHRTVIAAAPAQPAAPATAAPARPVWHRQMAAARAPSPAGVRHSSSHDEGSDEQQQARRRHVARSSEFGDGPDGAKPRDHPAHPEDARPPDERPPPEPHDSAPKEKEPPSD
jgi:hypothetical protein